MIAAIGRTHDINLIGAGTLTLRTESGLMAAMARQNMEERPDDPESGQPLVGIVLGAFDQQWQAGRIGQWIGAYRPDVLPTSGPGVP